MGFIFGLIVGGTSGIVLMAFLTINRITNLERENKGLKYDNEALDNAEYRAMQYAKAIKAIEDVYFGQGTIVDKYDTIGKVLRGKE